MELGFIIVNSDKDVSHLHTTIAYINRYYFNSNIVHILPESADSLDLKESKKICNETYVGGNNEPSMINLGFSKLKSEWGVIIYAGSIVRSGMNYKYGAHLKNYKDIFYPITIRNFTNFIDAPINGTAINKKFFNEVGNFPENTMWKKNNPRFNLCKMLWAEDARQLGSKFKAVLGCFPL